MTRCRLSLVAASALAILSPFLPAAAGGAPEPIVEARILDGWVTDSGTRMAAIRVKLAPGWKTYWRAPGDAGIPPSFQWSGSENLRSIGYHWPSPDVFDSFGMRTVGYKGELVLPIELTPFDPSRPIRLRGEMDLGVCEDICMPANLRFDVALDGKGKGDPMIRRALEESPVPGSHAGVTKVRCELSPISDGLQLLATIDMPQLAGREVALVEAGDPHIWVSEPAAERSGGALRVVADLVPSPGTPLAVDRSALRFTVVGSSKAVDITGCTTN